MAERPEAFGALRKAETKRALGLLRRETTDPARSGASEAARTGAGYIRANQARVEAAGASRTLSAGAGRHASDPVARALAVRLRRMERALAGPDGTPLGDRRLRDLDARISRAAGRIGRVPEGLRAAHGAPRSTVRGTRRATRALAARVGTVGVRVVAGVVRATGRGLGRE
jgi:hypothetical protein